MTNNEILDHYGDAPNVYSFSGTLNELSELMESTQNSYNYIKVREAIYFASNNPVISSKAAPITRE